MSSTVQQPGILSENGIRSNGESDDSGLGGDSTSSLIQTTLLPTAASQASPPSSTDSLPSAEQTDRPVVDFTGNFNATMDASSRIMFNVSEQVLWWKPVDSTVQLDGFQWYIGSGPNGDPDKPSPGDYSTLNYDNLTERLTSEAIPGNAQGILIDVGNFSKDHSELLSKLMNIYVSWTSSTQKGWTRSGLFSIANSSQEVTAVADAIGQKGDLEYPQNVKKAPDQEPLINTSLFPTATGAAASHSVDSNPGVRSSDSNPGSDENSGGSSGSGLSTGAKAGIGVACGVVGLTFIAALIFVLFRRRRNNILQGYKDQQSTTAFVEDKGPHNPTRAVTDGVAPSHSFRDDTHQEQQQVPLNGGSRAMDASHSNSDDAADPYHPYHDLPPRGAGMRSQASRSRQDVSSFGGPETPPAVPRNVAHLVEDGMTEDDIRRLEREEQELDEDLERAGRR